MEAIFNGRLYNTEMPIVGKRVIAFVEISAFALFKRNLLYPSKRKGTGCLLGVALNT